MSKVELKDNILTLRPLDYGWLTKALKDGAVSLPSIKVEGRKDDLPLFTASSKEWEQFLKKQRAEFPTYRDPRGQTTMALIEAAREEQFGYPATALVGKGGAILGLWIGYVPGDEKAVRQAVEKALLNKQKSS